ncbi:chaplin family protein [Actinomadura kijaniata]|uniref:chaplin family protein n=1 Tax=Actinomadura kijaniata TaxID=46161 RepID=UPI003F1D128C
MWVKHTSKAALVAAGAAVIGTTTASLAVADITSGNLSVLGGNQINAPVSAPVNISGNSAGVLGSATSSTLGSAHVTNADHGDGMKSSGKLSVGGGNQLRAPISAPVNVCGNSLGIAAVVKAACHGSATVTNHGVGDGMKTSGKYSVLGGNQAFAPVSVPVNVCGNAAAVVGTATALCKGSSHVDNEGVGEGMKTSGKVSVLGGNQAYAPVSAPVNVCGNALAVVGTAKAVCKGATTVTNSTIGAPRPWGPAESEVTSPPLPLAKAPQPAPKAPQPAPKAPQPAPKVRQSAVKAPKPAPKPAPKVRQAAVKAPLSAVKAPLPSTKRTSLPPAERLEATAQSTANTTRALPTPAKGAQVDKLVAKTKDRLVANAKGRLLGGAKNRLLGRLGVKERAGAALPSTRRMAVRGGEEEAVMKPAELLRSLAKRIGVPVPDSTPGREPAGRPRLPIDGLPGMKVGGEEIL